MHKNQSRLRGIFFESGYGNYLRVGWVFGLIAIGFVGFIFAVCLIARNVELHYDRNTCEQYEEIIGVDTKLKEYNYWSWQCLASVNGQWVDADAYLQLRRIEDVTLPN